MAFQKATIEKLIKEKDKDGKVVSLFFAVRIYDDTLQSDDNKYFEYRINGQDFIDLPSNATAKKTSIKQILKKIIKDKYARWFVGYTDTSGEEDVFIDSERSMRPKPNEEVGSSSELGFKEIISI